MTDGSEPDDISLFQADAEQSSTKEDLEASIRHRRRRRRRRARRDDQPGQPHTGGLPNCSNCLRLKADIARLLEEKQKVKRAIDQPPVAGHRRRRRHRRARRDDQPGQPPVAGEPHPAGVSTPPGSVSNDVQESLLRNLRDENSKLKEELEKRKDITVTRKVVTMDESGLYILLTVAILAMLAGIARIYMRWDTASESPNTSDTDPTNIKDLEPLAISVERPRFHTAILHQPTVLTPTTSTVDEEKSGDLESGDLESMLQNVLDEDLPNT